ncbi:hypothetical protein [Streptomyces sp. NPDC006879]|uniref:hypothetical protein n=1 Tax=Streptomyces sp. NPDC006879 TaxID=3364767 RepID=UPI0036A10928
MSVDWEDNVKGLKIEEFLARMDGVQSYLEVPQFKILVRAEENLNAAKSRLAKNQDIDLSRAHIKAERGRIDRYVVLEDTSSSRQGGNPNSALAIEKGRNAYDVTLLNPEGEVVNEYTVGAMDGLHILTDAARLPRKDKGGARVKRRVKIRMKKGGRASGRASRRD